MTPYVVWLDLGEAKIFKLIPNETEKKRMRLHGHKHFKHPFGKHEAHHHPDTNRFFGEICEELKDASELLIIGPGEGKTLFKGYLEKHFKSGLATKVIGLETVDHPTENQVLERARNFFKAYDLYHGE
ncbi:MAG: hypothetical protein P4M08_13215 [Oligoflexia bacterium]|nr:hypothetical protein [Oligoflexia bacterium]